MISEKRQDPKGNQISRVDYRYDDQNRLVAQTDAFAGTTEFEYDVQGRKTAILQPAPEPGAERPVTRYVYDVMDRLITTIKPDGAKTYHSYWPTGEIKQTWGSRQYPVAYTYDYAGRKASMTTWQDFEQDKGKAVTRWIYHPKSGHLAAKRYQDNQGPDYRYTQGGRLKERIWARGVRTEYDYNSAGELVFVDYKDRQTPDIQYLHDRAGRRVEVRQGKDYQQTLSHDDLGKVIHETVKQPGLKPHTMSRSFDFAGRRSGFEWNDGSNDLKVAYTYNPAGRLSSVSNGTHEVAYQYLGNSSHIRQITYKTQGQDIMHTHKSRDRLGRLLRTGTERVSDGVLLSAHDYTYNHANQRTSVNESSSGGWKYKYDSLGQLISGKRKNENGKSFDQYSYQFDDIGNRKKANEAGKLTSYESNLLNQYQTSTAEDDQMRVSRYRHDADGNLLEDEKWHYEWNAENRLIAMEAKDTSKRLEFRYDPQGRRIIKKVLKSRKQKRGWKKESTIQFIYDGWNIIAELDGGGDLVRSHFWGLDISGSYQGAGGVGGLVATKDHLADTYSFALYDGNGNVVQYIDADSQTPIVELNHDPFGNLIGANDIRRGFDRLPIGFSTKYVDVETGKSYYGFRYYDPETGRWLNRDPIEESGCLNVFVFCLNNSVKYGDPLGLHWLDSAANYSAGVADALTGGVTGWLRRKLGWDESVDYSGGEYLAGETIEIIVETTVTLGGSQLRKHAVK